MGSRTDYEIAEWQRRAGIKPAKGELLEALNALSDEAYKLIKLIERDRTGIRDGDGYWHGGDVIGGMLERLVAHHQWLMQAYKDRDTTVEDKPPWRK